MNQETNPRLVLPPSCAFCPPYLSQQPPAPPLWESTLACVCGQMACELSALGENLALPSCVELLRDRPRLAQVFHRHLRQRAAWGSRIFGKDSVFLTSGGLFSQECRTPIVPSHRMILGKGSSRGLSRILAKGLSANVDQLLEEINL